MNDDIESVGPEDLNQVVLSLADQMDGMNRNQRGLIAQLIVIAQDAVDKLAVITVKAQEAEVGELVRIASGRALAMRKYGGVLRGPDDAALIEDLCDQILALVKDRKPLPKPVVVGDVMTVEQAMELTGSRTYWQLVRAAGYKTPSIVPNWKAAGRVPDRVAKMIRDANPDAVVAQMVGEVAA